MITSRANSTVTNRRDSSRDRGRRQRAEADAPRYHYTTLVSLPHLLRTGKIDIWPELTVMDAAWSAWASSNPVWELNCAATPDLLIDRQNDLSEFGEPWIATDAARIVIQPHAAPHAWYDWYNECGMDRAAIAWFGTQNRDVFGGNPDEWFVSPTPIDCSDWLAVEVWDPERLRWISITESTDRHARELIALLPKHLQPTHCNTHINEAVPRWSLLRIEQEIKQRRAQNHFQRIEQDNIEHVLDKFSYVRARWICAERFRRMGFAVAPIDSCGAFFDPNGILQASNDRQVIDSWWLGQECGGSNLALALGNYSNNAFALSIRGVSPEDFIDTNSWCPTTLSLHEFRDGQDWAHLIFRSREELSFDRVFADSTGSLRSARSSCRYLRGPGAFHDGDVLWGNACPPAIAPATLIRRIRYNESQQPALHVDHLSEEGGRLATS